MAAVTLRRLSAVLALLVACVFLVAGPAYADPEGGTKTLRDALESAAKGQADAIQKLSASKKAARMPQVPTLATSACPS